MQATYLQLWWPPFNREDEVYSDPDRLPEWDPLEETYRCPESGFPLPTWKQALDDLANDPHAGPAVVMRFGPRSTSRASSRRRRMRTGRSGT